MSVFRSGEDFLGSIILHPGIINKFFLITSRTVTYDYLSIERIIDFFSDKF